VSDSLFEDRKVFFVAGRVAGNDRKVNNGEPFLARVNFKVSSDYRKKIDWVSKEETEKYDLPSRLWAQAEKTYTAVVGDKPKTKEQVTDFLSQGEYALRGAQFTGDDGTTRFMIVAIGPVGKRL